MKKTILALLLSVLSLSAASLTLEWDANPVSEQIDVYRIYEKTEVLVTGPTLEAVYTLVSETALTSFRLLDLARGPHVWVVTAVDWFGNESEYSDEASTRSLKPGKPSTLHIQRLPGLVKVSFNAEANVLYCLMTGDGFDWADCATYLFDANSEVNYLAAITPGVQLFKTENL